MDAHFERLDGIQEVSDGLGDETDGAPDRAGVAAVA